MKLPITLLLNFLCCLSLFGQQPNLDMCDIIKHSLQIRSTDSLTQLINEHSEELSNKQKADLYSIRARLRVILNAKDVKRRSDSINPILVEAKNDFDLAIDQMKDENDKLKYRVRRYFILEKYTPHYEEFDSDLELLKLNGYKEDKTGLALSLISKYDGDFWLGAEIASFSGFAPPFRVANKDNDVIWQNKMYKSASAFIFGYSRNLNINLTDINFSLIRVEAPFYFELFKFGYIGNAESTNNWYYRPELGFGYSIFQLTAGYNLFFNKDRAKDLSKFNLNLRAKYVF